MTHLDEGTIHAWIDGALDAERARAVESHAASCAQCSAAVAEARGLVAGASRILMALDDVPAGVVPAAKPGGPAWGPRAKRQWRAAPWVTGIAAALMLGVGLTQWRRDEAQQKFAAFEQPPTAQVDSVPVRAAEAVGQLQAARENEQRADVRAVRNEPSAPVRQRAATAAGAGVSGGGVADVGGRAVASADLADVKKVEAALPPPSTALVPPAPAAPAAMVKDAATGPGDERARDIAAAGCYAIDPATLRRSAADEVKAAVGATRAAGERAAPAAAPTRALASDQVVSTPPARVQLDTTPAPRGFVARSVPTGARLGFWYRVGDSLRVELLAAGGYTLASTARVTCP